MKSSGLSGLISSRMNGSKSRTLIVEAFGVGTSMAMDLVVLEEELHAATKTKEIIKK